MKPTAMLRTVLLSLSISLSFSGCWFCQPESIIIKPKAPIIEEAKVQPCNNNDILVNMKCFAENYLNIKKERDSLRVIIKENFID